MNTNGNILVTGSSGLIGKSLVKFLQATYPEATILTPSRQEMNLLFDMDVGSYFYKHDIDYVFMLAAKVGGIQANINDPVSFLADNLLMQHNLFEACFQKKVKKSIFLGSSCIYPKNNPQPITEESLLTGVLEPTNEGYALAKICGLKLAEYYYTQHRMLTVCLVPCNVYGVGDHYSEKSHVLSALVKKFVDAVDNGDRVVDIWGTGHALREFIYVDDLALALIFLMENLTTPTPINVGTGQDISIRDLAEKIAILTHFNGQLRFDTAKPDGMKRKLLDVTKLIKLGFVAPTPLFTGIELTIDDYKKRKASGEFK